MPCIRFKIVNRVSFQWLIPQCKELIILCISSQILRCTEGPKSVVDHWFQEVDSFSVKARSGRSQHIQHDTEKQNRLLETGVKLKAEYERLLSSTCSTADGKKKKPIFQRCTCEDCFSQSDTETDSNTETPPVKFKYPKKIDLLKYPRYAAGIQLEADNSEIKVTKNFSMSQITSVLDLLPNLYKGLTMPYFYIGEEHSFFPAHTEDGALYSANYLHAGFPKIWLVICLCWCNNLFSTFLWHFVKRSCRITISPEYCDKVRDSLKRLKMDLVHTSCVNSLSHKYYVFTLQYLKNLNIPYHIVSYI